MLVLPLSDDVDHRDFPIGGVLLTLANLLVLAYMFRLSHEAAGSERVEQFVRHWGLVPADLAHGAVVGVVSHIFLHAGIIHLVGNLLCFWAFVHSLESALGTWLLCGLFIFWGAVGGLTHAMFHWGTSMPLVGASGAVAGMIGAYWVAFGPLTKIRTLVILLFYPLQVHISTGVYVAFWMFTQLAGALGSPEGLGGIAWYAHLGGFAAGALTMLVVVKAGSRARLTETANGNFCLQPPGEPAPTLPHEVEPQREEAPSECPHCGTPLSDRHRLAANLLRCPNPSCQRCIYLEEISLC